MKKRLIRTSLLPITFGLILFCSLSSALGFELSSSPHVIAADGSEWRLLIDGLVQRPLNLTFDELVAMPNSTEYAELYCFDEFVAAGNWTGVRLGLLLEKAGLHSQAVSVAFYAADGYTTTLPIAMAMHEDIIIAYEKDGRPLPETLRLVVPGENGDLWISMIIAITVGGDPSPVPSSPHSQILPPLGPFFERYQIPQRSSMFEQYGTPQQSPMPQPWPAPQPKNQSTAPSVIPPSSPAEQHPSFLGSSLPMEYGYAIIAAIVVAVTATVGFVFLKRRK